MKKARRTIPVPDERPYRESFVAQDHDTGEIVQCVDAVSLLSHVMPWWDADHEVSLTTLRRELS